MDIGILGTGIVGRTIGSRLVELGPHVSMGSRQANNDRARAWARSMGQNASYGSYAEAGSFGEILFNCTAGKGSLSALEAVRSVDLHNKILMDVSNPLDFSLGMPALMTVCNYDSLGEQIQRSHPTLRVVKTLNTMNVDVMVHPKRINGPHDALLCGNDSMALGAVAAVKAAGRSGQIQIIGYDGISAVREAIKEGAILATIEQHADRLAVFGIEYALQLLRGESTLQDKQTPVELVTAESLK